MKTTNFIIGGAILTAGSIDLTQINKQTIAENNDLIENIEALADIENIGGKHI